LTLGLHCNLQFSVAASLRRICDVFSVNLRLQFPFNNNNNNNVLGFMSEGVVVTKIMTFFYKMLACRPSPASGLG